MNVTPVPDVDRVKLQEARELRKRAHQKLEEQRKFVEACEQEELDLERAIIIRLKLNAGHSFSDDDKYLVLTDYAESIALARDRAHEVVELRRRNGTK